MLLVGGIGNGIVVVDEGVGVGVVVWDTVEVDGTSLVAIDGGDAEVTTTVVGCEPVDTDPSSVGIVRRASPARPATNAVEPVPTAIRRARRRRVRRRSESIDGGGPADAAAFRSCSPRSFIADP
jgi:hypothetical protein